MRLVIAAPYPMVPGTAGMAQAMAAQRLRNAGFQVRVMHEVVTSGRDGAVLRQTPIGSSRVKPHSVITLVIANVVHPVVAPPPPPTAPPDTHPASRLHPTTTALADPATASRTPGSSSHWVRSLRPRRGWRRARRPAKLNLGLGGLDQLLLPLGCEAHAITGRLVGVGLGPGQRVAHDLRERPVGEARGLGAGGCPSPAPAPASPSDHSGSWAPSTPCSVRNVPSTGTSSAASPTSLDRLSEELPEARGRPRGGEDADGAVLHEADRPRPHVASVDALHRRVLGSGQDHPPAPRRPEHPPRVARGRVARPHDVRRADDREPVGNPPLAGHSLAGHLERAVRLAGDLQRLG